MNDPDMVVGIGGDADHVAHDPVVGQRLGPHRVYFESWRQSSGRLNNGSLAENRGAYSECDGERQESRSNVKTALHASHPPFLAIVHD